MTHNMLRCELWLDTLEERLHTVIDNFRMEVTDEMLDQFLMAMFFVFRECR